MIQLPLFPTPSSVVIIKRTEILEAWTWLLRSMSPRPNRYDGLCVYDLKLWSDESSKDQPLSPTTWVIKVLSRLYLTSELGVLDDILNMVNGENTQDVVVPIGSLDEDVKKVVKSKARFRNALSEHLAFWIRLATAAKSRAASRFACSLPNVQPEDKGPDGLFLSAGAITKVEVQSVKNSISDPQAQVSTKTFRTSGRIPPKSKGKLLEDFYKFAYSHFGFTRLERDLVDLCRLLNIQADRKLRIALLSNTECSYNAVVVANYQYAEVELFKGYQYVTPDVQHRIATYIGSSDWPELAEQTRKSVEEILRRLRLLP